MRWTRILAFAAIYFLFHIISVVFFTIKPHLGSPELAWYLQHPLHTLTIMFWELIQSPLLILSLLTMILYSLVLGFATDWFSSFLKKRIQLRKGKQRTETQHPKH